MQRSPQAPLQNARALLRNSLPIKNKQIRSAQLALESISEDLRVPGVRFSVRLADGAVQAKLTAFYRPVLYECVSLTASSQGVESSVRKALEVASQPEAVLKDVPPAGQEQAKEALAKLKACLQEFKVVVDNKDKQEARARPLSC